MQIAGPAVPPYKDYEDIGVLSEVGGTEKSCSVRRAS